MVFCPICENKARLPIREDIQKLNSKPQGSAVLANKGAHLKDGNIWLLLQ